MNVADTKDDQIRQRARVGRYVALLAALSSAATAQDTAFQLDPAQTSVKFTLADVLHTVRGTFQLKHGGVAASSRLREKSRARSWSMPPAATAAAACATARCTRKFWRVVSYPDIAFRPDRIDGTVASQGKSSVKIHGMFNIHGTDHEITVPAEVEMSSDHWTATVHFTVPYAKWGMKNPSTLFLRVNDSVEIDLVAAGTVAKAAAVSSAQ